MTSAFSRRKFITSGALVASGMALGIPAIGRSSRDIIKIGIIGTGDRGTGLASLLRNMPGAEVVACCDTIPANLANGLKVAAKGARGYQHYKDLLNDKNVNAVIIATPLFLHYDMAVDALDAGKHIYLEKSMTYDIQQSLDLVKKVRASNVIFQLGFQYRYFGLYRRIKEIIAQKWLGKITHFESQYNRNSNWRKPVSDPQMERVINWRLYREYCGGPLSELCAHQIDMINYLLDSTPQKAVGMGGVNYWTDGRTTFDHIRTIYEYPGGIKSGVSSTLSNAFNSYNIKIFGDRATVEIQRDEAFIYAESFDAKRGTVDGVTGATINATTQGKPVKINFLKPGEKLLEPTTYALADFLDCIRTKRKPVSNEETGKNTSIAIHMGNNAAETETIQLWKPEYNL